MFKPRSSTECVEFFDPYGDPPSANGLKLSHERVILFNDVTIQGDESISCAKFCLYYEFYRSIGATMTRIVNSFSSATEKNEEIVDVFMSNMCKLY